MNKFRSIRDSLKSRSKLLRHQLTQRGNGSIDAIRLEADIGMFAQLNWCLYFLEYCEIKRKIPAIQLTSRLYTQNLGDDWLGYFFDSKQLTDPDLKRIKSGGVSFHQIGAIRELGLTSIKRPPMSLDYANQLINKHLRLNDDLTAYLARFSKTHFHNKRILGIHFRGTDKESEAKRVTWEFLLETVHNFLTENPHINLIFVSSDEEAFIHWFAKAISPVKVIFHNDSHRSKDGNPIHINATQGNNYSKGKEALINCLLLSKCEALIRTTSFLSGWSSVFNPKLPVVLLNRPFDDTLWFPDASVAEHSMDHYLPKSGG